MAVTKFVTIFFSGTYEQIIQITDKTKGSFYYAQDKDAWYSYFGNPLRLRRVSDIYQCETESERLGLTSTDLFESKLYIVKETGMAWWNETGAPTDWLAISNKTLLRDDDEELLNIDTSEAGKSKLYSTDKLREIVTKVEEGDVLQDDSVTTDNIKDGAVTLPKIAMKGNSILGRNVTPDGQPLNLSKDDVIEFLDIEAGANKYVHPNHSGDVTSLGDGVTAITDEAVKLGKMAKLPSKTIIGNDTDNPAIPKALTIARLIELIGGAGGGGGSDYIHPNHSGDVVSVGDGATTITNSVVSLAKMSNLPANTFIGNDTNNVGTPKAITKADMLTFLNVVDGANNYTHPNHSGDVTSFGDGSTTIVNSVVSLAKMSNLPANTIIGNNTASAAVPKALTKAEMLTFLGLGGGISDYVHPNHSGDVTSVGDGATTIVNSVVSLAKMSNLPANTFIGNNTASTAVPKAITKSDMLTFLNVVDGANKYVHPNHSGDVTSVSDGLTTITDEAVKLNKMAKLSSKTIIGNDTDNPATPKALTIERLIELIGIAGGGGSDYVHPNHSGDVTSVGDGATTIVNSVVSLAKMSNLPANTIIGNNTASTAVPKAITKADMLTWLGVTTGVPVHYHDGSGTGSTALGQESTASGSYSTALGDRSQATVTSSTAVGNAAKANGGSSTALGYNANAASEKSTALGQASTASGENSTALGQASTASGVWSTSLGYKASASGDYSTALGWSSTASGINSTSVGLLSKAGGSGSTAIGVDSWAIGRGSLAVGGSASNSAVWGETTSSRGQYSSAIGIGAIIPATSSNCIQLGSDGQTYPTLTLSSLKCKVALTVTSDIRDKTDIKNIPVNSSLDFINKLEPIQYVSNDRAFYLPPKEERTADEQDLLDYYGLCDIYNKEDHDNGTFKGERKRVGLSAQQVQSALADVFGTADYANIVDDNLHDVDHGVEQGVENQLSVAYQNIIPFLIGAIKEQQNRIDNQQEQIDDMKNMLVNE